MVQFSSKPPFNDDPEPYECNMKALGGLRHTENDTWTCVDYSHRPRPEYDLPQHNRTNPILEEFRDIYHETTPTIYQGYWELAEIWLELMDEDPFMREYRNWGRLVDIVESDHIHHARRVFEGLTR